MSLQHEGAARRLLWDVSPIVDIGLDGWPHQLHAEAIAALQAWREGDDAESAARAARKADILQCINDACQFVHVPIPARPDGTVALPCEQPSLSVDMSHAPAIYSSVHVYSIKAADFAAWLTAQGESPSPLVVLWFKAQGVQVAESPAAPEAAPSIAHSGEIVKRAALIERMKHKWPTVEADLNDSSRNGLTAAAKVDEHGMWNLDKAREWANQRGMLRQAATVHSFDNVWPNRTTRNRLEG